MTITIKPKGDYIKGKFVRPRNPEGVIESMDPGDSNELIGQFPIYGSAPERAIEAARTALTDWAALPVETRINGLQKLRAELRNRSDDLAKVISAETGRPLWETRNEVQSMYDELDGVLRYGLPELEMKRAPSGRCQIQFRPLGVVAVLAPYPQPALLLHADAVAAMAAGCTTVCKPSELTPATGQLYAEIVNEADLPRGVFNMVQGDAAQGAALVAHPGVDGVLFNGSEAAGRRLLAAVAAAERSKMVRTVMSGHNAALVLDDANLDDTAFKIIIGGCLSAGQRCTSTRRVIVHRRVAPALTERLSRLLQGLKIGYCTDPDIFMGPLISDPTVQRYIEQLKQIEGGGGEELHQGGPLSIRRRGHYVTPALYKVTAAQMAALAEHEACGPALLLTEVSDLEEGVELVNGSPLGLVMSVFGRSERDIARVQALQSTSLCLHNLPTTHWPAKLPLIPRGRSGNGMPAGTLTARTCTKISVHISAESALDTTTIPPGLPRA